MNLGLKGITFQPKKLFNNGQRKAGPTRTGHPINHNKNCHSVGMTNSSVTSMKCFATFQAYNATALLSSRARASISTSFVPSARSIDQETQKRKLRVSRRVHGAWRGPTRWKPPRRVSAPEGVGTHPANCTVLSRLCRAVAWIRARRAQRHAEETAALVRADSLCIGQPAPSQRVAVNSARLSTSTRVLGLLHSASTYFDWQLKAG